MLLGEVIKEGFLEEEACGMVLEGCAGFQHLEICEATRRIGQMCVAEKGT